MLVAELKWLINQLPAGNAQRTHLENVYGQEIEDAHSDGETIDPFTADKDTIPELLRELDCPEYPADRRVPYPPGALHNMPRPLPAAHPNQPVGRVEGRGWASHMATTAPLHDLLAEKGTVGSMYDLAAARTFQRRPEGGGTSLDDHSWVTVAYRVDKEQQQAAVDMERKAHEDELQKQENMLDGDYPDDLRLCSQRQHRALATWYKSDHAPIVLPNGRSLSKEDIQRLTSPEQTPLNTGLVDGFMLMLRNYTAAKDIRIAIMDTERTNAQTDEQGEFLHRAELQGVTAVTLDSFQAMTVPVQTGSHFSLVLVLPQEKRIVVYNPDAPLQSGGAGSVAKKWLRRLTSISFVVEAAPNAHPAGMDICGLLICYDAALYVVRGTVTTLGYIDSGVVKAMSTWVAVVITAGVDEKTMGRLSRNSAAVTKPEVDPFHGMYE